MMFRGLGPVWGKAASQTEWLHINDKKWLVHQVYPLMPERLNWELNWPIRMLWRHHINRIGIFDILSWAGLLTGVDVFPHAPVLNWNVGSIASWITLITFLDYPDHPRINCDITRTGLPTDCDRKPPAKWTPYPQLLNLLSDSNWIEILWIELWYWSRN